MDPSGRASTGTRADSWSYSSCSMPALTATTRSGCRASTSSTLGGLDTGKTCISASPARSSAHGPSAGTAASGKVTNSWKATGCTSRASRVSTSVYPSTTMRSGADSIVVSPKAFGMVTG